MIFLYALIAVSSRTFVVDRIGTITQLHCPKDDKSEDCEGFEKLAVQPQMDWERLEAADAKSKKKVEQAGVDQYGGLWYFWLPGAVRPAFAGYKTEGDLVEVITKQAEFDSLKPKKKKGFKRLFTE